MQYIISPVTTYNEKYDLFETAISADYIPILLINGKSESESRLTAAKTAMLLAIQESEKMMLNAVHPEK